MVYSYDFKSIIRTTSVKVHMHCEKCEHDLRKKLLKHKGIHSVKTDFKAQTVTVQGTIESDKLLSYFRKKVHKQAELITSKPEPKKEEKQAELITSKPEPKKEEKKEKKEKEEKKEKDKVEVKSTESAKLVEFKEEVKVEVKTKDSNTPYFIHYVYAPQLFSDENPNACSIM